MTNEQETYLICRGAIADLPQADRQGVAIAEAKLRAVLHEHNDHAIWALTLIAAELAARD